MITILYKINYIGNGGTHYKTPNNGWDCGIHLYMFITPLWRCHYGYVTTLLPRQNNATMKDCKKWRLLSLISHTNDFTNQVLAVNTNITTPKPSQELHSNHTSWWPCMFLLLMETKTMSRTDSNTVFNSIIIKIQRKRWVDQNQIFTLNFNTLKAKTKVLKIWDLVPLN